MFATDKAENEIQKYEFAFVSRYLSILEAMANKRLVFALYDNPSKKRLFENVALFKFIVIENSPEKLAKRIKYYLNHEKAKNALIDNGFSWARNQTWDNLVDKYLNIWNK